jgi:tetratricopeptide (TPR) repeat protein
MNRLFVTLAALGILILANPLHAGLYYSGEAISELPSQWRGFLVDQRTLRNLAIPPAKGATNPEREKYEKAAVDLEKKAKDGKLTADELADLGAIYVRLGQAAKAVELLRGAQRDYPQHFHIAANLGTAWQMQGDLEQAAACLKEAVKLAPGKYVKAEEYHLKLVRLRLKEEKGSPDLDNLFDVKFVGESGKYQPGKLSAEQRKKLPSEAAAVAQQLALWLPADPRLLWQLAELASAHGDVKTAAAIMDGCVNEFSMRNDDLRAHRAAQREAADELAKQGDDAKTTHEGHAGVIKPRSRRPLASHLDESTLPAINEKGVTPLPWVVLAETSLDKKFAPSFAKYLKELDGKQISLAGFMQPLGEELESGTFMLIEYPVGCWYCEMPEITAIVFVEMPVGKTVSVTRGLMKITGTLKLNAADPESFLYSITKAKVTEAD